MEETDSQKLKRVTGVLLAMPFSVIATTIAIYFAFWKIDPLIRFIHMIWVLGFWILGTVTMFAFIIRVRLKPGAPYLFLVLAFAATGIAIYFSPLSRFADVFSTPLGLMLSAAIGVLNMTAGWLFVFRFRKSL